MEWNPVQNSLFQVDDMEHRDYLRRLNVQIAEHERDEVNYQRYLNDLIKEYDENELKRLSSEIENYEIFKDEIVIVQHFSRLDEISTDITLQFEVF